MVFAALSLVVGACGGGTTTTDEGQSSGVTSSSSGTAQGSTESTSLLSPEGEAALERLVDAFLAFFGLVDPADALIQIFFPENAPRTVDLDPANDMPDSHTIDSYAGGVIDLAGNPFSSPDFDGQVFGDDDLESGQYFVGFFVTLDRISLSPDSQSQFGFAYRGIEPEMEGCELPGEPFDGAAKAIILDLTFGSLFGLECREGSFTSFELADVAFFTLPELGDNVLGYAWRISEPGIVYSVNPFTFYRTADNGFAVEDGRFHTMFDPSDVNWPIVFTC